MPGKTIVVVEDDPLLRTHAVSLLGAAGLAVVDFETADEAVVFLEERDGDVAAVLTDVRMPGRLDGFDLAVKISMKWPDVTVLLTSGLDRPTSLLIPSVAFLPKPWMPHDVLSALEDATGRG
ncbi:response regulator [Lichenibacterium ramalinae]|jgi:DNA-binding NtrC family response regulator|uniref:Response regulator n=1 Tax=Lichenibacterium ramalinae TaxID=2316527 RepID=A0A4Q2RC01_9HYPH|nr:response regulator [Lichenibacterium ramalinae]RYB03981.1 response regulator [Lichenibacterium ramalinae]